MRPILPLLAVSLLSACANLKPLPDPDFPLSGSATKSDIPQRWQDIPTTPLSWTPPLVSSYADTLRPGVVVYWVPDNSLPVASVQWVWPEGRMDLSAKQAVAADLLGALLRRGGAGELSGAQVDDTLEFLAAHANVDVGLVRTSASVSGLSKDLPFLVDLMTRMILKPRLDTARLEVLKDEALQDLEHRFDTPAQTQGATWDRVAYGRGPWTALTDSGDLARLTSADVRAALQGRFGASRLWISVAGRFDKAAVRRQLLDQLDRLAANSASSKPVARLDTLVPPGAMAPLGVYVYDIPATQVQIRIGTRFVRRDNPDYLPLMLASYVLGGSGFGSRLVDRVRSDEGLAYHVSSWAGSDYDREATLGVMLQTKTVSTGRALLLVNQEIARLADSGFREGELAGARRGLAASLPSIFDTPENIAGMLLQAGSWGRRDDHFRLYQRAMDTIPDSTILRVYRKWFRPDSMRVVISGPLDSLTRTFADGSPAISHWGEVHRLTAQDLEQPGPLSFEKP